MVKQVASYKRSTISAQYTCTHITTYFIFFKKQAQAHTYDPSTREAEAGESLGSQCQPELHTKTLSQKSKIESPTNQNKLKKIK